MIKLISIFQEMHLKMIKANILRQPLKEMHVSAL